jgi:predicted phage gp36 major capsid-like protein
MTEINDPNANKSDEQPRIHIDADWKTQAEAEKQRLAEEVESAAPKPDEQAAGAEAQQGGQRELPPANFETLVSTMATQVLMALGGMQDRRTGKSIVDLDLAKFHIDCLTVLEEKTRGNLSDDEKNLLDQVLYETRMHYVQVAQQGG